MIRNLPGLIAILLLCAGFTPSCRAAGPSTTPSITIDFPVEGAVITGPITITGTYNRVYNPVLFVNAGAKNYVSYTDDLGPDKGHWSMPFDPAGRNGNISLLIGGTNSFVDTMYKVYGATAVRSFTVNLPQNAPPTATITSPVDGSTVPFGIVPISFTASAVQGTIASAQIQIDLGTWVNVAESNGTYTYNWDTRTLGNKVHCIKAKVVDRNGNVFTTLTTYTKTGTPIELPYAPMLDRAMWIWGDSYNLLVNPSGKLVLDELAKAKGIKTFYYYLDIYMMADLTTEIRAFNKWAHQNGYTVFALLGESNRYSERPFHRGTIDEVEMILNLNATASDPDFRFDGINDDAEPAGLPGWADSNNLLKIAYLDKQTWMMDRKAKAGSKILIGAAIQRGWDVNRDATNIFYNGTTNNMAAHVQNILDYVSLMDYRNAASGNGGQIDAATGEMNYAATIGKKVVVGSETDWIVPTMDPQWISYRFNGSNFMESQFTLINNAFAGQSSYGGLATHHFTSILEHPTDYWYRNGATWNPILNYNAAQGQIRVLNGGSNFFKTTVSDVQNPTTPVLSKCVAFDYQRIDLKWPAAKDDVWVDHYELHRSTTAGFTVSTNTLANNITDNNRVMDTGLMPSTTYYYKVVAVDMSGKRSAASNEMSATTLATTGKLPMYISDIQSVAGATSVTGKIKVVNQNGVALSGVSILAGFDGAAGRNKGDGSTGTDGYYSWNSETLIAPYTAFVVPIYVRKQGYYWAKSMDLKKFATGGYPNN